jgi:hypothetical protein
MVQLTHLFGMDAAMDEWIDSDQTDMYHGQRRMMQLLTWKNPGSQLVGLLSHLYLVWLTFMAFVQVMKCPMHTYKLQNLATVFKGASFVWLHRDPKIFVASLANLMLLIRYKVSFRV